MKICIYGAGAIGGYMGLMLQEAGADVSLIARGAHRTSMLQDFEKGRALEIDALLTAVQEMGRLVDAHTPNIDAVLGLVQQLGRVHGVYPTYPKTDPGDDPEEAAVD